MPRNPRVTCEMAVGVKGGRRGGRKRRKRRRYPWPAGLVIQLCLGRLTLFMTFPRSSASI